MVYFDPQVSDLQSQDAQQDASQDRNDLAMPQEVAYSPDANQLMPQAKGSSPQSEIEQYIRQQAIARGMDPDIALKVASHEGLHAFDPSKPDLGGDEGSSFGPFQLHYAGMSKSMPHAGLGDEFTKATGLNASDPSTWKQQVDFSLDHAAQHGWGAWMGAKAAGVGEFDGINGAKSAGVSAYSPSPNALALPPGAASAMGGNAATPSPGNKFPPAPQSASGMLQNSQAKRLMALMFLKSAMNNVQLQRVDYDPWAVIGGKG